MSTTDRSPAPDRGVPRGLRIWFLIHFWVDLPFALSLLIAPVATLTLMGWQSIDPLTARWVGAAWLGIGGESWLGRNASAEVYHRAMLDLKLIWSLSAVCALALSLAQGAAPMAWAFLALFAGFFGVWVRYRLALRQVRLSPQSAEAGSCVTSPRSCR